MGNRMIDALDIDVISPILANCFKITYIKLKNDDQDTKAVM